MCCPKSTLLAEDDTEFDLRVRGLLLRLAGEGKTGIRPRTPSIVSRTCKPKPAGRTHGNSIREPACTRTVSPSVHPRPASGGATDFFLASALFLHPALRPNGGEDTRCDRPISATHTNYVHPHLARFQLALTGFPVGDAPRSLGLRDACWRTGCFTTPETASADHEPAASLEPTAFRPSGTSVGVFFPRCRYGRASDTPVATAASSSASSTFVDAATWPSSSTFDLARWVGGCCCRRDHP